MVVVGRAHIRPLVLAWQPVALALLVGLAFLTASPISTLPAGRVGQPAPALTFDRIDGNAALIANPALFAAVQTTLQRDAGPAYFATDAPTTDGSAYAVANPGHGFSATITPARVALAPTRDAETWTWGMELSGYGRGGALQPLPEAALTSARNLVELDRGILTEWYLNGPFGLEQGFTLHERPGGAGDVRLDLALTGTPAPVWAAGSGLVRLVSRAARRCSPTAAWKPTTAMAGGCPRA